MTREVATWRDDMGVRGWSRRQLNRYSPCCPPLWEGVPPSSALLLAGLNSFPHPSRTLGLSRPERGHDERKVFLPQVSLARTSLEAA